VFRKFQNLKSAKNTQIPGTSSKFWKIYFSGTALSRSPGGETMSSAQILIVEDDLIVAQSIQFHLTNRGYDVPDVLASGQEAVDRVAEIGPDLILMDIGLGGDMDGVEAAEQILACCDIPVIYLTSYTDDKTLTRAKLTKPYGYIVKPFEAKELLATVEMALYKHEMEQKLRGSEQRLQSLFDTMAEGVILIAPDGQIVQANPAAERILRLKRSEIEARSYVGSEWEILRPDGTQMPSEEMAGPRAMKEKRPVKDVVMGFKNPDGSVTWLNVSALPLIGEAGKLEGVVGTFADITERKQAEEALREAELRYRTVADFAHDWETWENPDGTLRYVSPSCERITGYTVNEFLDNPGLLAELIIPEDRSIWAEHRHDVMIAPRRHEMQFRIRRRNGEIRWIEHVCQPVIDEEGMSLGCRASNRDITIRKQAEEAMQDSVKKLRVAYKQATIYAEELTREVTERKRAEEELRQYHDRLEELVEERTIELTRTNQELDRRQREATVLAEMARQVGSTLNLEEVLDLTTEYAKEILQVEHCMILTYNEHKRTLHPAVVKGFPPEVTAIVKETAYTPTDGTRETVLQAGQPLMVEDAPSDPRISPRIVEALNLQSILAIPMEIRERVLGVLALLILRGQQRHFTAEETALALAMASQAAMAMDNAQLYEQAQQVAVLEERQRLARDLHDSVTQSLYSLTLLAEAGQRMIKAGERQQIEENQTRLAEIAQQALQEIRLMVYELRPLLLEQEGLVGALRQRLEVVERRAGVDAHLVLQGELDLPTELEEGVFRIAQEALNNAMKHARASAATVTIRAENGPVILEVVDDGHGFDPEAVRDKGGLGLVNMQERAERLGGELTILSAPGKGTIVKLSIELEQPEELRKI
jgi:PAS domain S-box-containing protein